MKNPFSGSSRAWKGLTLATSLIAISSVVMALTLITWNAPVSLVVDTIDLEVYWEPNCTTPVTTIDFGNIEQDGSYYYIYLYIKNEGLGPVTIHWNSTLSLVTDQITESWYSGSYLLEGRTISHDQVMSTYYRIYVFPNVDPGSYSWTLYLSAEQ